MQDLYYSPLTSTKLYRIQTEFLKANPSFLANQAANNAVEFLGERGGQANGFESDTDGRIYMSMPEHNAIYYYDPADLQVHGFVRDPRILWADSMVCPLPCLLPSLFSMMLIFLRSRVLQVMVICISPSTSYLFRIPGTMALHCELSLVSSSESNCLGMVRRLPQLWDTEHEKPLESAMQSSCLRLYNVMPSFDQCSNLLDNLHDCRCCWRIRHCVDKALAHVASFSKSWIQRNFTQELKPEFFGKCFAASGGGFEDFALMSA